MNRSIVRLYGIVLVLFALLVAFTSRWTIFDAGSLRSNRLNRRVEIERERTRRGRILAADGAVLARDVRTPGSRGSEATDERRYPFGALFAQTIGYSYIEPKSAGIELYRNRVLESGSSRAGLSSIIDHIEGRRPAPDTVVTTLEPHAQQVAMEALGHHAGAVVAIEPSTGAVRVMASSPSFDPEAMRTAAGRARVDNAPGAAEVNRATEDGYAPGSTFKIVTATAAIDTGSFTLESVLNGDNDLMVSGKPLANDDDDSYGDITLTKAFADSVNTVWAQVALRLGKATMQRYMRRFGFDRKPELDYPAEQMSASGEYERRPGYEHLLAVTSPKVDLGRMGIGQDKLEVTPLQMAEVAAAVANHGRLMVPHLTERIVGPEGRTVERIYPRVQSVVMKPSTAKAVTTMMEAVVNEGTGTEARIPGVRVAGKTGTAETQFGTAINDAWFVAFAPASAPRVAVAATVEKVPGYGATYALPVARRVMEALLE